jgi:hypothetical protein
MNSNHLCGFCAFCSRWLVLSFKVLESSMRGQVLEEPAGDSGEALTDIRAWTALLGDGGRIRNKEESFDRYPRFFCRWWVMIMWVAVDKLEGSRATLDCGTGQRYGFNVHNINDDMRGMRLPVFQDSRAMG